MPGSALQSDFSVNREPVAVEIPEGMSPEQAAELPRAFLRRNEATARSTKIVMTFTFVMLAILLLICAIGPHIPSGE
ncbi:MAG: hypothetical protein M4D80_12185 [Myxococcota bacterium]|nr:hypothetical protein [Deltaproteobacteria bacterium]MDQ3335919.1 hypothetical protein [Myxococcota bacterium]